MLEILRYSIPLYFVMSFAIFIIVFTIFICKKLINNSKNLKTMINFFGRGFNFRQISKDELTRIFSFCEEVLVNKYHFVKDTTKIGANNEYDIVTFYKEFKEYNSSKPSESFKIQLVPDSNGCSMNVICVGSNKIVKHFILFYNHVIKIFKESKIPVNTGYNSIIKIINIPSFTTEFEIEPQYIKTCKGYVETFRSNAILKQQNSPDPIVKPIIFSLNNEPVKDVPIEKERVEPVMAEPEVDPEDKGYVPGKRFMYEKDKK